LGRHLFVVHTDEKGVEKTIQGLPERVPPNVAQEFFDHQDHDRTAPPEASPWRRLVFKSEIGFDPNGTQSRYHPALRGPANIKEGKKTCLLYRCLENAANAILNANLSYWPHDQNSNAFAATILKKCFLPRKRPFGIHPGWSLEDLIAPGVGR
jgi:hypothetical protein